MSNLEGGDGRGNRKPFEQLSPQRRLAEQLVAGGGIGPDGRPRLFSRAEIERELIRRLGVTRNQAQSAASKAVRSIDPDNPVRITRRYGAGSRIQQDTVAAMADLRRQGATNGQIAAALGINRRTVYKHLGPKSVRLSGAPERSASIPPATANTKPCAPTVSLPVPPSAVQTAPLPSAPAPAPAPRRPILHIQVATASGAADVTVPTRQPVSRSKSPSSAAPQRQTSTGSAARRPIVRFP